MKPLPPGLRELLELAEADRARDAATARVRAETARRDGAAKAAATAATMASQASARAGDAQRASSEASAKLEAGESELRRLSQQMDVAGGMKEFEGLKTRIEARGAQNALLEEAALVAMERAEAAAEVAAGCAADADAAARTAAEVAAECAPKLAELEAQLAIEDAHRREAAGRVPEALLRDYEHLAAKSGGRPVVPYGSGSCDGCFTSFGAQVKTRLAEGEIVRCGSCGRFVAAM